MYHRWWVQVCIVTLLASATAHADKEKARAHFRKGMAAYMLDRYEQAIPEFESGFNEEPEAAFLYNLAQSHARLGHLQQAINFYRKYLDMGAPPDDVAQVQKRIEELEAMVAHPPPVAKPISDTIPVIPPAPVAKPVPDSAPIAAPTEPNVTPPAPATSPRIDLTSPPPQKSKTLPIVIGVAAAVVVVAVVVGLAVGLSRSTESSFVWDAR